MGGSVARLVSTANSRLARTVSQKQKTQTQKQSTVDYKNNNTHVEIDCVRIYMSMYTYMYGYMTTAIFSHSSPSRARRC